ncbi:TMEM175 family protein [Spirosoma pollinicola]|uniref:DUF1211 domain-containing protein n=1 Tax=Spirosoma pollinicola TaxID=2057025 RepID=A0A2K8Z9R6_9BACT|nr:TMEM175 family protein [Spirosoma pollinicola]AUD06628.1 hypothetical protein CWM47_35140 [Spirosoma pollinicola]
MKLHSPGEEKPKTRLEALADGTFAIVFTILVLELFIRNQHFVDAEGLCQYLLGLAPKFLSYLLSFAILATYWLGHAEQLYFVRRINRPFVLTNLLFLFFIALIPFSTSLISEYSEFSLSTRLYGLNLVCCQLAFYWNWQLACSPRLQRLGLNSGVIKGHQRYIVLGLVFQLIGIGISYLQAWLGLLILALIPLTYLVVLARDKRSFDELYLE